MSATIQEQVGTILSPAFTTDEATCSPLASIAATNKTWWPALVALRRIACRALATIPMTPPVSLERIVKRANFGAAPVTTEHFPTRTPLGRYGSALNLAQMLRNNTVKCQCTLTSPRTRFQIKHFDTCPNKPHVNCVGLAVCIVYETGIKTDAVNFAQQLRGIWEGHGWPLHLTFYERPSSHGAARSVRIGKRVTTESSRNASGIYCRTIVLYFASDDGSIVAKSDMNEICDMITESTSYFPFKMSSGQSHGLVVFAGCQLPNSQAFLRRFQAAIRSDGCAFRRVMIYGTTAEGDPIWNAFSPAIMAIRAIWGRKCQFDNSIIESLMRNRWAANIMVAMGERQEGESKTQLCSRLNLATTGWEDKAAVPLCDCTRSAIGDSNSTKHWVFVKTNSPGKATMMTLRCSHCDQTKLFAKPPQIESPGYKFGEYYRLLKVTLG
ncbi:hypothetical protein FRC11_008717 [Ceratobasidium sp. 423]|nr:hypothetical protein FRC11_008717 [Ceratobasidium sp. 423]